MPNRSRKSRRPEEKCFMYTRGIIEKNVYFFQKGYFATGVTSFPVPLLIMSYL